MSRTTSILVSLLVGLAAAAAGYFGAPEATATGYMPAALFLGAGFASFLALSRFSTHSTAPAPAAKGKGDCTPCAAKQASAPKHVRPAPVVTTVAATTAGASGKQRVSFGGDEVLEVESAPATGEDAAGKVEITVTATGFSGSRYKLKVRTRLQNIRNVSWTEKNLGERKRTMVAVVPAADANRVIGAVVNR